MIYPGAIWNPGVNAGYNSGHTTMQTAVCHYTVGYNSTGVGLQGYFNFLVSRDGTVQQFAEADAKCWHAGDPWNGRGPGIEIEYMPDADPVIFTPAAYNATAGLIKWLSIPQTFYDGNRVTGWNGYITHRSLVQSGDYHYDYWTYEDWNQIQSIIIPAKPRRTPDMTVMWINFNGVNCYLVQGGLIVHQFHGAPNQFGIPEDGSSFAYNTNCGIVEMTGPEWEALLKRTGIIT